MTVTEHDISEFETVVLETLPPQPAREGEPTLLAPIGSGCSCTLPAKTEDY